MAKVRLVICIVTVIATVGKTQPTSPFGGIFDSFVSKFLIFVFCIAFFTAAIIEGANYLHVRSITLEQQTANLRNETALIVPQIDAAFDRLRNDVLTISRMPPFRGIARAALNRNLDPTDASTAEQWRARLETIFSSIMAHRPEYVQMRFIRIADGGRELVRVNRHGQNILTVPADQMQLKGTEPYVVAGRKLPDDHIDISQVTMNRDFGKVQSDTPVIRIVTPIYEGRAGPFGLLVINAHYGILLQNVLRKVSPAADTYIVNDTGDYIERSRYGSVSGLRFRGARSDNAPPVVRAIASFDGQEKTSFQKFQETVYVIHQKRIGLDGLPDRRFLWIALVVPQEELLAGAQASRKSSAILALALIVLACLLSLIFARMFTRPLEQVVDEIRAFSHGKMPLDLPVTRNDELGQLSRAFDNLTRNLDESRRTERATLNRTKLMRKNAADALIAIDENGIVLDFNDSAAGLFGYSPEEVIGNNVKMLMPAPYRENHDGYLQKYRETGESHIIGGVRIVTGLRKNGSTFPAELRVGDIRFGNERYFNGTIRDIGERVAMEKKVAEYTSELERSNRDLDDFAYIASHDLKEPLRGIANHVRFLEEDYPDVLGDDGKRRIARLKQLCERADKLTSDLLQWSRLGRASLELVPVEITEIVEEVRHSMAEFIQEKNATVKVVGVPPPVIGDRSRIASVFRNLIVNAIKYNDSDEKVVEIGFLADYPTPDGVRRGVYFVRDNGIGIAAEFSQTVFAIFKRLNSEKAYGPGTGAGLSFVKKIVERHGGQIWLNSKIGEGTTFYFTLGKASDEHV